VTEGHNLIETGCSTKIEKIKKWWSVRLMTIAPKPREQAVEEKK